MPRKPTKSKPALRQWRIWFAAKGQYLGRVDAPDAEAAIKAAIEQLDIRDPQRQRQLIAQPVE